MNSTLSKLEKQVEELIIITLEGIELMSNNFQALSAALDSVEQGIRDVAAAIANPAVDNNDQATIDALTARLNAAADALAAAKLAEDTEDGVVPAPAPAPAVDPSVDPSQPPAA